MTPVAPLNYSIKTGGTLRGRISVPGDKSISHRALMLGAIASGNTHIKGFLPGEDTLATMAALRAMGVKIDQDKDEVIIHGVGLHGLVAPDEVINLGNSGTSARLFAGLLSGQKFDSRITGDASLMKRPMRRVVEPLQLMNADISCSREGTLPLIIHGGRELQGMDYTLPVASAQLKSCLLLAGLYANSKTCLHEPVPTRDHTERMLQYFGGGIEKINNSVCINKGITLKAKNINVPADISSAAFFMVGATIAVNSDITLERVGVNPTRSAVINILQQMGADITLGNQQELSGEPVADIRVQSSPLKGIEIPLEYVPSAIDEFPVIMIAAACASGTTLLHGAAELRVKESDRIRAITEGLQAIGITAVAHDDGMEVTGGSIYGGSVNSYTDHRIAMAFIMAGLVSKQPVVVHDCANINTSFPGFVDLARTAGMDIQQLKS